MGRSSEVLLDEKDIDMALIIIGLFLFRYCKSEKTASPI